jgi:diguanylate cyclase (GGDEF)-like protein/PAS domain S-box-containing protein
MLAEKILPRLTPIILVINRKGNCRIIQFACDHNDDCSWETSVVDLNTIFAAKEVKTVLGVTREVLKEQTPKPLTISLNNSEPSKQYFSYLFPLSLGSVILLAQPLPNLCGESKEQAIELFPLPTFVYQVNTFSITAVNQVAIDQYGYSQTEFLEMSLSQLHPSHKIPAALQNISQLVTGEWQHYRKDGKLIYVAVTGYPIHLAAENSILLIAQDITEYRYTKTALQEKKYGEVQLTHSFPPCGVLCFDAEWHYTLAAGNALSQLTETTMAEKEETIEGKSLEEAFSPELRELLTPLQQQVLSGHYITQQISHYQNTYYLQGYPVTDQNGSIQGGILILQNLTPGRQLEALLDKHAFYDPTTNLPNKNWLLEQISTQIHTASEEGLVVILLKLRRYGVIKYGLGHEVAESLMIAVAQRLKQTLQLNYEFARVGDATIAVVLPQVSQKQEIEKIVQLIHFQMSLAVEIEGQELFCPVSVGVAIYEHSSETAQHLREPSALLHAADTAMNAAQGETNLSCVIFHPNLYNSAATRVQLETDLRRALRLKQLDVFYQPTVTITEGKLAGFEALVRWQHPEEGLVSPNQFMPLAEELGLMGLIDWWVLAEACEKLAIWQKMLPEGNPCLSMNVNLSESMINQVGILERLDQILKRTSVSPQCLKLEVTEGIILEGKTSTTGILKQLQQMGVLLSIDDFGTGYSSLQRLHQLPINVLKIDRSFIQRMLKDPEIMQIVKTIINLAHDLNMDVIAEGIEKQEEWEVLQSLNCEYGQGFFFSKPLPEEKVRELLQTAPSNLILV